MRQPFPVYAPSAWSNRDPKDLRASAHDLSRKLVGRDEDHLCFLTVSIAAYEIDLQADRSPIITDTKTRLKQFKTDLLGAMKSIGSIDTKLSRDGSLWVGACEIDLIDASDYLSKAKQEMLTGCGIKDDSFLGDSPDRAFALLHAHIVMNWRGASSYYAFDKVLREAFPGKRRVHIAKLYADKTTAQNITRMTDYATKFRFSHTQIVETETGTKTSLTRDFHASWEHWLKHIYLGIGGGEGFPDLLIANMAPAETRPVSRSTDTRLAALIAKRKDGI